MRVAAEREKSRKKVSMFWRCSICSVQSSMTAIRVLKEMEGERERSASEREERSKEEKKRMGCKKR